MRLGDSRLPALACALAVTLYAVTRITNRSPGAMVTRPLGFPFGMTQDCCDLARARRNGLITRRPRASTAVPCSPQR